MTVIHRPRPPLGYSSLAVSPSQILLHLTISNKCGQAFRWHAVDVYEPIEEVKEEFEPAVKQEYDERAAALMHARVAAAAAAAASASSFRRTTEWSMCLADRVVFVRQDEERGFIYYKSLLSDQSTRQDSGQVEVETGVWLRDYLNLDVPLESLYEEWSEKDKVFSRFAKRFTGVRMLRQDPWETLCAFICSSNNNIARIGQMVQNLCKHFSEPIATVTYPGPPCPDEVELVPTTITYYPFPQVGRLAHKDVESKLRNLAFGYRARYIQETAQLLLDTVQESDMHGTADEYLHSIRTMDYHSAREQLVRFPGVGPKVADCILLMAMDQPSSIPVDRHVFQFAERWYGIRTKGGLKGYERIAESFRSLWGEYAGWAHSVLFTADLRAFQTYKVEKTEEVLDDGTGSVQRVKEELVDRPAENVDPLAGPIVKAEEEEKIKIADDGQVIESGRTIRWKKRVGNEIGTEELTKSFKGTKRGRPMKKE